MITIEFYNNNRKNAKGLKRYTFDYNNYTELNYIYTILSYIVQCKPKYYTINLFKDFKSLYNGYSFNFNTGYRNYKKIYDIESVINNMAAFAFVDMGEVTIELSKIYYRTITRQLIAKYYHGEEK